jgi:hypothetical protein
MPPAAFTRGWPGSRPRGLCNWRDAGKIHASGGPAIFPEITTKRGRSEVRHAPCKIANAGPLLILSGSSTVVDSDGREIGETEVSADFGHETSRQVRAGPGSGLRRPVRVPAPDQEQGGRADHHDDAGTDSVGRPSRGEAEGGHKTTCEARFRVGRCFWARRRNRPGRRLLLPSRSNV